MTRSVAPFPLVAALALAACSPIPSGSPVAIADPTPTASPTPTQVPRFTQPPPPPTQDPNTCDALGFAITTSFEPARASIERPHGLNLRLRVEHVVERADPNAKWSSPDGGQGRRRHDRGYLRGGRETPFLLSVSRNDRDNFLPAEPVSASVRLRLDDGREIDLPTRFATDEGPRGLLVEIPDILATGVLEVRLDWQDRCLAYSGAGSQDVRIVQSAKVASCPASSEDPSFAIARLQEPAPEFGGVAVPLHTGTVSWVWDRSVLAVDAPIFFSWDRDQSPATGGAGDRLRFLETDRELTLDGLGVSFYRRRDVVAWLEGFRAIDPVVTRRPDIRADGTFDVRLPTDPGRYVATFGIGWGSDCFRGVFRGIISVDVE